MVDELALYARVADQAQDVSAQQALTLIKFGHSFSVKDHEYWRFAVSHLEQNLLSNSSNALFFDSLTYLKEFGMHSNRLLREVLTRFAKMDSFSLDQLVLSA